MKFSRKNAAPKVFVGKPPNATSNKPPKATSKRTYRILGTFERVVLDAVHLLEGHGYGITIRQHVSKLIGREVSTGAVYTTLDRLESKGLVKPTVGSPLPHPGGRARKCFKITAAGIRALDAVREYDKAMSGADKWVAADGKEFAPAGT